MFEELENVAGVYSIMSSNRWMNEDLTKTYLRKIIGALSFSPPLLVWDSFRCHISEAIKYECQKMKIDLSVIPGGCTGLIQVEYKQTEN
jgi:hypothetical protein